MIVGTLDSNEPKRLLSADSNALYSPPDQLLFVRDGTLLHQSFNASTLELSGEATPIAGQVAVSNGLGAFSASETGVLAVPRADPEHPTTCSWPGSTAQENSSKRSVQ